MTEFQIVMLIVAGTILLHLPIFYMSIFTKEGQEYRLFAHMPRDIVNAEMQRKQIEKKQI